MPLPMLTTGMPILLISQMKGFLIEFLHKNHIGNSSFLLQRSQFLCSDFTFSETEIGFGRIFDRRQLIIGGLNGDLNLQRSPQVIFLKRLKKRWFNLFLSHLFTNCRLQTGR